MSSLLQKIFSFLPRRVAFIRVIASVCILALLLNVAPEMATSLPSLADEEQSVEAQAPPTIPTGAIVVGQPKDNGLLTDTCDGDGDDDSGDDNCDIGSAIDFANNNPGDDTIVFRNSVTTVLVSANLPSIEQNLIIDGFQSTGAGKTIFAEDNITATIDYFLRIEDNQGDTPLDIEIRNIAFTKLAKITPTIQAVAITTDDPLTSSDIEGALIDTLLIEDNFFGTTDGNTINSTNVVAQAIRVFMNTDRQPEVDIRRNNFINVILTAIQLGAFTDGDHCEGFLEPKSISVNNNKIGIRENLNGNDSRTSGDEWGTIIGYGVITCNLAAKIENNIIGNSRSDFIGAAIEGRDSSLDVSNNDIGQYKNGSTFVENMQITGFGVSLYGNYIKNNEILGSKVHDNRIAGIKKVIPPYQALVCNSPYWGNASGDRVCGGTAVLIHLSSKNLIYANTLGMKDVSADPEISLENEGYGIELEGAAGGQEPNEIFLVSTENKIFDNTISYNKADGIIIPAVNDLTQSQSANDRPCEESGAFHNNCFNTINQNRIFRNGRYNDAPVAGQSYNGGGIGIDLKSGSGVLFDYAEQKHGTDVVTTGTNNDEDITFNDSGDGDNGGNGLQNYPSMRPVDDPTFGSSADIIYGELLGSADGSYWVEVFRVRCDAEDDDGNVTETNALTGQCDTDQISVGGITGGPFLATHGQGSEFLCGAYVNKTLGGGDWDCRPEDFGVNFTGGLITATATEITNTDVGTGFGPSITPTVKLKYSCELARVVLGAGVDATGQPCLGVTDNEIYTDLDGLEANLIQAMGSTSEFSQDIFIPEPALTIEKEVRGCTGATPADCTSAFAENSSVTAGSTVEFRIDIANNGNSNLDLQNIHDALPSGMTYSQTQCQSFLNQNSATSTRPGSGSSPCTFSNGTTLDMNGPITLQFGKHLVIYVLAVVDSAAPAGTLTNIATVIERTVCVNGCDDDATVTITPAAQTGTLVKEIITPNTDSDTSKETVPSPASATDVNYRITLTLRGTSFSNVANANLTDTFPKVIKPGTNVVYTNCQFTMQVNAGSPSAAVPCPATTASDALIATAPDNTPILIWPGSATPVTVTPSDTLVVVVTYKGTIPANPLLITDAAKTLTNTATWRGPGVPGGLVTDSTDLTITPPVQNTTVAIRHRFDTAGGPATATVTSSTSATVSKDYFITVDLANVPSGGLPNFTLKNNFVTTGTNFSGTMTYDNCSITYIPSTPAGFPTTCTGLSGAVNLINLLTVPQTLTTITVRYRGTVPANAVNVPNVATIVNRATVDAPSLSSGVSAAASASADATLIINGNVEGTPNLTLDKRADNNVTGTDRSSEKIYSPGETVNYTVTINNAGNGIANGASLRDTLERNLTNPSTLALPSPATGGFSGSSLNISNINVPASGNVTIGYRGTLEDDSNFDLDNFDLDSTADPKRDEDFYAPSDADIEEDIDTGNNRHTHEDDLLDIPDGKFVSLGNGGEIVIDLGKKVIVDGSDGDFGILELDRNTDDTDQSSEAYTVSVSQDGNTYERLERGVTNSDHFDIGDTDLTWARFIKLEDDSSTVKANAPGADIDAICLFNIGVRLPNKAEVTFNGQTLSDTEYVTVDVTDVFDDSLEKSDCAEKTPAPTPLPPAPQPPYIAPPPPMLPKTGPIGLGLLGIIASGIWVIRRKK